jgi:DnaJ-class molecular chaperone
MTLDIVKCSECDGTGKVRNPLDPTDPQEYPCPMCGGSGELVKEK